MQKLSFQEIILKLLNFWSKQGCTILQPYDMEVGAGTFHPATALNVLGPNLCGKLLMYSLADVQQMADMGKPKQASALLPISSYYSAISR